VLRKFGSVPVEFVRFGLGDGGRFIGADWDRPYSSLSLSPEFRLSYGGCAEPCGANIEGGADGDGGLTDGVSDRKVGERL
jgi:hypothetical protein